MDGRTAIASLGFGVLGAAVNGLWLYAVTTLFVVYPPPNMGISLPVGLASGFLCYLLAYQAYARSGHLLGSFFGGLAGSVSGAATGIGYLLSFDQVTHAVSEFFGPGIAGAMFGGLTGMIMGIIFGPLLAKVTKSWD
jgi:hypothetical protein